MQRRKASLSPGNGVGAVIWASEDSIRSDYEQAGGVSQSSEPSGTVKGTESQNSIHRSVPPADDDDV